MKSWRAIPHLSEMLVALMLVGAVVAYAIYVPPARQIDQKWIGFAINSLFVFGFSLAMAGKRGLKQVRFWLLWLPLLGLHCGAFYLLLSNVSALPLVWYIPSDAIEVAILGKVVSTLPDCSPSERSN